MERECTCTWAAYAAPAGGTGWDVSTYDDECPEHGDSYPETWSSEELRQAKRDDSLT